MGGPGPADAGALSGTISFLKASLPLFLIGMNESSPVSSMPEAWNEAAVGTAAVDLCVKGGLFVNDRFDVRILSTELDLTAGSTRRLDVSGFAFAISPTIVEPEAGVWGDPCVSIPPKFSAISSLDCGLGEGPLRRLKGCGLAARERLVDDPSTSWPGLWAMCV